MSDIEQYLYFLMNLLTYLNLLLGQFEYYEILTWSLLWVGTKQNLSRRRLNISFQLSTMPFFPLNFVDVDIAWGNQTDLNYTK